MASVGERLRIERETRNTTLEQMVVATGIGQSYLDALERDAVDELPGKAFGKLYIRAYAEVFGFDPQPWIDDYDREQRSVQGASTEPALSAPAGSRPVAEAIARWKAARAEEDKARRAVEPAVRETVPEAAPKTATEPESPSEEPGVRPVEISEAAVEVVVPDTPVHVPTAKRSVAPLLLVGVVVIASAIYFGMRGKENEVGVPLRSPTPTIATPPPAESTPEPRLLEPIPPVVAKARARPPMRAPAVRAENATGKLTVTEFGVGLRVVNLHLEGESDHFAEGVRVCFASRVLGGQRGDLIRHVWLYEGRVEQSIPLRLGGTDFRTHSNKTLGHAGQWAVEVRDDQGAVLARVTFTCLPPDR